MADDFDREAVIAKRLERRAWAEEAAKLLPQVSVIDLIRQRNDERRAAEDAGQLDLGADK